MVVAVKRIKFFAEVLCIVVSTGIVLPLFVSSSLAQGLEQHDAQLQQQASDLQARIVREQSVPEQPSRLFDQLAAVSGQGVRPQYLPDEQPCFVIHSVQLDVDAGHVSGEHARRLLGRSLVGSAIGLRGSLFSHVQYEFFLGKPISKPRGFKTPSVTGGFSISLSI